TGGTIYFASQKLKELGAKAIWVCATHAILSGDAVSLLENSPIDRIIVTDTIPIPEHKKMRKLEILTVSGLIAEAIKRIHEERSISALFI
ncbi:MAG: ribose-phosphate pyrophosphokinase, partial [candidate division WOR-3 bacterium]